MLCLEAYCICNFTWLRNVSEWNKLDSRNKRKTSDFRYLKWQLPCAEKFSLGKLPLKSTSSKKDIFIMPRPVRHPCKFNSLQKVIIEFESCLKISNDKKRNDFFQVKCKRDLGQEAEVQRWIEAILGEKVFNGNPYEDVLKDGVVLCKVMNTISPGLTNIPSFFLFCIIG